MWKAGGEEEMLAPGCSSVGRGGGEARRQTLRRSSVTNQDRGVLEVKWKQCFKMRAVTICVKCCC